MSEKKKVLILIAAKLRSIIYWRILRTMVAVADPGPGSGLTLFLDQTEARRNEKKKFLRPPPPYLRIWMTAPPPLI